MTASPRQILFRADAGPKTGSGHLMRCMALAQACKKAGLTPSFLSANVPEPLASRIAKEGFLLTAPSSPSGSESDAAETADASLPALWTVVDGYSFTSEFLNSLSSSSKSRIMVIDDCANLPHYHADIVLNQNAGASKSIYAGRLDKFSRCLSGTSFALLRDEFTSTASSLPMKSFAPPWKVLLTLGGGSNETMLLAAVETLAKTLPENSSLIVATGSADASRIAAAANASGIGTSFIALPNEMATAMAECNFAISAGGSTSWELLFSGVPSIIIPFVENQMMPAKAIESMHAAVRVMSPDALRDKSAFRAAIAEALANPKLLSSISSKGRSLVDGLGASRVLQEMLSPSLRHATMDDCQFVFSLSNDPDVRRASFSSGKIPWETHLEWFSSALESPSSEFYILETCDSEPAAQVRFAVNGSDASISISMAPSFRGKGLASKTVSMAADAIFRSRPNLESIHAFIKPDNSSSAKTFARASFAPAPHECQSPFSAPKGSMHLILKRAP